MNPIYEFFSYDRHDRYDDMETRDKNSITKSEQHVELHFSKKKNNKTERDKIG